MPQTYCVFSAFVAERSSALQMYLIIIIIIIIKLTRDLFAIAKFLFSVSRATFASLPFKSHKFEMPFIIVWHSIALQEKNTSTQTYAYFT